METSSSEARLDIFTDNSYDNDPEPVLSGNITETGTAGQSDGQGEFIDEDDDDVDNVIVVQEVESSTRWTSPSATPSSGTCQQLAPSLQQFCGPRRRNHC